MSSLLYSINFRWISVSLVTSPLNPYILSLAADRNKMFHKGCMDVPKGYSIHWCSQQGDTPRKWQKIGRKQKNQAVIRKKGTKSGRETGKVFSPCPYWLHYWLNRLIHLNSLPPPPPWKTSSVFHRGYMAFIQISPMIPEKHSSIMVEMLKTLWTITCFLLYLHIFLYILEILNLVYKHMFQINDNKCNQCIEGPILSSLGMISFYILDNLQPIQA